MKYFWMVAFVMMFALSPTNADAWSQWNVGVGFSGGGGHGGYGRGSIRAGGGNFHRQVRRHAVHRRSVIRHGGYGGYRGGSRIYSGRRMYGGRSNHIHRQQGRVYYQGSCGMPVVVVPSGRMYRY